MEFELMLKEKFNLVLPDPPKPGGVYSPIRQAGNLLYLSGQTPTYNGTLLYQGILGKDYSIEEGQKAAEICALNLLAILKHYLGNLNQIKQIVQLLGYVRCSEGFIDHPQVINGASNIFAALFGDKGLAARMALGTNELPGGAAVEIMMIVEI